MAPLQVTAEREPTDLCRAVHAHWWFTAMRDVDRTKADLAAAYESAKAAGVSPRAIDRAHAAMRQAKRPTRLDPETAAIIRAIETVAVGDVESSFSAGALLATPDTRRVSLVNDTDARAA